MRAARAAGALALVVAALAPRVGPALAAYHPSNDAAEHALLARALARGEGFTLPIRVRDPAGGPAVHEAFAERAPLYPLLLSLPVRAGVGAAGWPDPRLQLLGAALAALCAPLAASIALELCRRRGLGGWGAGAAAVGAGLVVAWAPSLVRASIHLWAEPLGLLLVLAAARADLALDAAPGSRGRALLLGLLAGLARFARPEAWVLVPLVLLRAARRERREQRAWVAGALLLVNVVGVGATGVLAPQLSLLSVGRFEDTMGPAAPAPPDAGTIARGVASNLLGQLEHLLLPKNAWLVLPLAALALVAPTAPSSWLLAWAGALVAATAGVWSTADPHRFTIAPLALLAPVALVEAEAWRRRLRLGRRALALHALLLVLVLGHAAGEELRDRPPPGPPAVTPQEGAPALADPWSYALLTGRPALLR